MAENVIKRFAFFKTLNGFKSAEKGTDYDENTLIFIKDSKLIKTHNTDFQALPDGANEGDVLVYNGTSFEWKSLDNIEVDGKELSEVLETLVSYEELASQLEEYAKLTDLPDVSDYFDGAEYVSATKQIQFKHGSEVKATIDATPFIKDGMVENVEVNEGNLEITFNTDAGKETIKIALTEIFNPENYYLKTEIDTKFEDYYNKKAIDDKIDAVERKIPVLDSYAKIEYVDNAIEELSDTYYSKEEVDTMFEWYEGD